MPSQIGSSFCFSLVRLARLVLLAQLAELAQLVLLAISLSDYYTLAFLRDLDMAEACF